MTAWLHVKFILQSKLIKSLYQHLISLLANSFGRVARQQQSGWHKGAPCAADPLQQEEESHQ